MKINGRARREAKQLFRMCLVNGVIDENRVGSVVQRVAAAGHRDCLAILMHFRRLVKLDLVRRTATIESATPLPADVQAAVEAGLAHRYGRGLTTLFGQRPALIGGMRIQVGCDVYDGSIQGRLAELGRDL